ncbi:hypothetical protein IE53DRAFT_342745 [Violaceomyces palustris]|uniref:Uncharacterized protein n=1 Tax=Violaceomyces palustris TaxID=1673888 RepID=A0ACD0NZJ0_9BASI|nr:hypothetical protein IE53DRAFT_342745 [Violaceomyces palustris]
MSQTLSPLLLSTFIIPLTFAYVLYVRSQRYLKYEEIHKRYSGRYSLSLEEKKRTGRPRMTDSYQGVRDAQRIVRLSTLFDHRFMAKTALEFGLFQTYGIPTISQLLLHTGQLSKSENAARRYVDTSGLIMSMMAYPIPKFDLQDQDQVPQDASWETLGESRQDPRSAISIARINWLHRRWKSRISNQDLLYTLSVFVLEPPKWIDAYEWRKTSELEKEAFFALWYHLGRCMGIQDIPGDREALARWTQAYEVAHMVPAESNASVAHHTIDLLLYHAPAFIHPYAKRLIVTFMNERLRKAMTFERPSVAYYLVRDLAIKIRAFVLANFFLPRSSPKSFVPLDCQDQGTVFNVGKFLAGQDLAGAVCPASGLTASSGKVCPVGGHQKAAQPQLAPATWRMEFNYYENEPVYSRGLKPGSFWWMIEVLKVKLGVMKEDDRRGSAKLRSLSLPSEPKSPIPGLGGYRLEEMGPKGLEMKGREEVLREAEALFGHSLEGIWAFGKDEPAAAH